MSDDISMPRSVTPPNATSRPSGSSSETWLTAPRAWRLSTRITVVLLATLIPLLLVVVWSYAQLVQERRDSEIEGAELVGQTVAAVVDGFARDIEGTTLAAALALGAASSPLDQVTAGPYLDGLAREYPVLRAIFVTDLSGRVVAAQRAEGVGVDLSARPYIQALRAGGESIWTPALVGSQSQEVTVVYGRTVHRPDGAARGYLIVAYYPPNLLDRLAIRTPADADISFYDNQGYLLHSTARPDAAPRERDVASAPRMQAALAGRVVRVDGVSAVYGGEPRFGVLVPVSRIGWVVAFTRPLAPLEAHLRFQIAQQAGGIALVILGATAILAWLTRRLVRPIGTLAQAATGIARGERPEIPAVSGDVEVMQLAAGMAAMSQAVADREDALRRQSDRLAVLAEASRTFAEVGLEPAALRHAVARVIARGIGDGCVLSMLEDDGQTLAPGAIYHPDPEALALAGQVLATPRPHDRGLAARLIRDQQPILLPEITPDMLAEMVEPGERAYSLRFGFHSLAAVPLLIRGQAVGALAVWRDRPGRPYGADDVQLLRDLADRAALALDNAQLFNREGAARHHAERAAERMRRLQEITSQLSRSLEAEEILAAIARSAAELLDLPIGAVFLLDAPDADFLLAAAHGLPPTSAPRLVLPRRSSLAGRAVDVGRTLIVEDARGTPGTALPALLTGQDAGSEMAAPIIARNESLGVVKVFSPETRRFSSDDADLLSALASAAAVALINARLYRDVREAVRARDEFLSIAAHELKTPLTALMGNAQLLQRVHERGQLDSARLPHYARSIADASRRLSILVNDLLDVSRLRLGQLALRARRLDLAELVAAIVSEHKSTIDPHHTIELTVPPAPCSIVADPERLRQVLENLLDNALKYSPSGGTVRVELTATDDELAIHISDQGIGLPPDATETIFEPFGRAPNAVSRALPGMGLGLYICRNIVERHGGRLWAESAGEDQGTTIHVHLPCGSPTAAKSDAAPATASFADVPSD